MFIGPRSRAARSRLSQGSACQAERFRATFKEKTFGAIFPTLFPPFGANMPICILQLFLRFLEKGKGEGICDGTGLVVIRTR